MTAGESGWHVRIGMVQARIRQISQRALLIVSGQRKHELQGWSWPWSHLGCKCIPLISSKCRSRMTGCLHYLSTLSHDIVASGLQDPCHGYSFHHSKGISVSGLCDGRQPEAVVSIDHSELLVSIPDAQEGFQPVWSDQTEGNVQTRYVYAILPLIHAKNRNEHMQGCLKRCLGMHSNRALPIDVPHAGVGELQPR